MRSITSAANWRTIAVQTVVVLGDGAEWIWQRARAFLGVAGTEVVEIVDIYHAYEYLWAVGTAVFGSGSPRAGAWVEPLKDRLYAQGAAPILAALALLLFTAVDWYSTVQGNEARQIQHDVSPQGALGGEVARNVQEQAAQTAAADEHNIWQEHRLIDRLELIALLGAAFAAATAATLRVAGKRFDGWLTPSAIAALLAAAGALLVLYRLGNQPGDDAATTLKSGPWLALAAPGVLGFGASLAVNAEREGTAWKDASPAPPPAPTQPAPRTP